MATQLTNEPSRDVPTLRRRLQELVPLYDDALKVRNDLKSVGSRKRIFKQLDTLDTSICALKERINETRRELDKVKRSRKGRSPVRGSRVQHSPPRGGRGDMVAQRRLVELSERIREAARKRAMLDTLLDNDQAWRAASREFYDIRHSLLELIAQLDEREESRATRKQDYLAAAALTLPLCDVWSDATSPSPHEINLFYGGRDQPDGVGHGHVILVRAQVDVYTCTYHRKPTYDELQEFV